MKEIKGTNYQEYQKVLGYLPCQCQQEVAALLNKCRHEYCSHILWCVHNKEIACSIAIVYVDFLCYQFFYSFKTTWNYFLKEFNIKYRYIRH